MSIRFRRTITRKAAEQLLDGLPGASGDHDQLVRVLAAAAASGREDELAGEALAMAAFEARHRLPVTTSRREQLIRSPLRRILTAKALVTAALVAVIGTGGVALAASTGAFSASTQAHPAHVGQSSSAGATSAPSDSGVSSSSTGATAMGASAKSGANLARLCRALAVKTASGTATAASMARTPAGLEMALAAPGVTSTLSSSTFSPLVTAASSSTAVPGLCALALHLPKLPEPADLAMLPAPLVSRLLVQEPGMRLAQLLKH